MSVGRVSAWLRRVTWVDNLQAKSVFITGCDTGFGNHLAKSLCSYGLRVYAGCITKEGGESLRREAGDRLLPVTVDVRDTASVTQAAQYVTDTLPFGTELWGLVNNAGILGYTGPVEFLTKEDFKEVFEVNVYGLVDMTNAFLPLIKKSKGRIVNMASIGGNISFPNWTPYISSKHAAKGFSECLRLEKDVWGIKVCTVQPGFMKTNLINAGSMDTRAQQRWDNLDPELKREYGDKYVAESKAWTHDMLHKEASSNIHKVVEAYEHALLSRRPRGIYYPGFGAKSILFINSLPRVLWDQYILRMLTVFPAATRK